MAKKHHDVLEILTRPNRGLDEALCFSRCPLLSLSVPRSKQLTMCRILKPFVKHFDVIGNAFEVLERDCSLVSNNLDGAKPRIPYYTVSEDKMSSPALAIMLFLPELGKGRAERVKLKFQKAPWRLHHSIQLHSQNSSDVIGKQEFYFLSRNYPLWSVCAGHQSSRVLRINIFVRRFSAMVEFYRLVTGSEMESSKPGFCLFKLNTQNYNKDETKVDIASSSSTRRARNPRNSQTKIIKDGNLSLELALKQCPNINPFTITDAYLTFPVPDIISLRTILHNYIRPLTSTHYLVYDPDGNPVILFDMSATTSHRNQNMKNPAQNPLRNTKGNVDIPLSVENSSINSILSASSNRLTVEKASIHSESLDSGRFSDFETMSYSTTDLDQCMAKLFPNDNCSDSGSFLYSDIIREHKNPSFKDSRIRHHGEDAGNILKLLNDYRTFPFYSEEREVKEGMWEEEIRQVSIGDLSLIGDNMIKKKSASAKALSKSAINKL